MRSLTASSPPSHRRSRITLPLAIAALALSVPFTAMPGRTENPSHMRQLLSTRECAECNLSNAGLVFAELRDANLQGANLMRANLSQADLQGADLRGANLMGASLAGANLMGAKLDGAILRGADLRGAYLSGASMNEVNLDGAMLQGVMGLPSQLGQALDFYNWALRDAREGKHDRAVDNFNQALSRKPDLAEGYMGRAVSRLHLGDRGGAIGDIQKAEVLFQRRGDERNAKMASVLVEQLSAPPPEQKLPKGNGLGIGLINLLGSVLQLLPVFGLF